MMKPFNDIFRIRFGGQGKTLIKSLLLLLSVFQAPGSLFSEYSDLPYTSPSTGADGALLIQGTLPTWVDSDYPVQLAYDTSNGFLMALGMDGENSQYMGTFVQIDGEWVEITKTRYLSETTLCYDAARNQLIRFGGIPTNSNSYQTGPYIWNGSEWIYNFIPVDARPSNRSSTSMVFDSVRNEVLLFGGKNTDGNLNDTWAWNGTAWTDKTPATSPSTRTRASMAFDVARSEVVLFGGRYKNDTWTWNGTSWTEESPTSNPPSRESSSMAYDPVRQVVVLCVSGNGTLETWEWNGSDWTKKATTTTPGQREFHGVVYNPESATIELHNGEYPNGSDTNSDSWSWDGSSWTLLRQSPFMFDMTKKPDGIWNFTTIDIGQIEVKFRKNAANSPVIWLATGDVIINGHINLDGSDGYQGYVGGTEPFNTPAPGGPGGYDGGLGGYFETATGNNVPGNPGMGPGGGAASLIDGGNGNLDGYHASHFETYNSPSLQALSGGSGGGGAASTYYSALIESGRGGNGGGGGGAILIASSRDIWVNGSITAIGGEGRYETYKATGSTSQQTGISQGGSGSGGSIRLVADRIFQSFGSNLLTTSNIATAHDRNKTEAHKGLIRIEAFYQNTIYPPVTTYGYFSVTTPKTSLLNSAEPDLIIASIAGQSVSVNPSSDPASPEVTFSSAGAVNIVVSAQNIPDGTTINLRVTSGSEIVTADPQVLAGGTVTFSLAVPAGKGIVQSWTNPEPAP